jgi:uncharacterized protein YggE
MKRWIFVLVALALPALAQAQVHALPDAPHILVKGHAQGSYVPDRFTVDLQVTATDPSPGKARDQVEQHIHKLFKSIDAHGALSKLTRASSLSMSEATHYDNGKQIHEGTEVDRSVSVTFDSLAKMQGFISDLPASKQVLVQSTRVGRSDRAALMMELRARAIANSRTAARQLAKAYGVHITGVYSISEVAPDFSYGIQAGSWNVAGSLASGGAPAPPPPSPRQELGAVAVKAVPTHLRTGTIQLSQDMYAVYMIATGGSDSRSR